MTPLNSILGNSSIILDQFQKCTQNNDDQEDDECMPFDQMVDSIRFLQAIQQSGKIMYYYNLN